MFPAAHYRPARKFARCIAFLAVILLMLMFLGEHYLKKSSSIRVLNNSVQHSTTIPCRSAHTVQYKHLKMAPLNPQEHYRPKWFHDKQVNVEDKSHLLPYLLGQHVDFSSYPRVVLLDLGAKTYQSSVKWFLVNYPGRFNEVYAFEKNRNVFHVPNENKSEVDGTSVVLIESTVGTKNTSSSVDIADFMLNAIKLQLQDMVVMKMDIEGAEWQVLKHLEDSGVLDLVDELLVEMHYHHPVMAGFGWNQFPKTLNETNEYFKHLRKRGLYVHPWP